MALSYRLIGEEEGQQPNGHGPMPTFLRAASFTNASRAGNLRHLTYAVPCGGLVLGVPRERKTSVGRYEHTRAALQALPQPLWGHWERRGAMSTVVYHRVF